MHVGMGVIFQGQGEGRTDRNVYRNELRMGDLAEPLGFESLWGVEHHFTDYTMCPDVLQYLTYFAGRTEHDPARLDGRRAAVAFSRSASPSRSSCSTTCRTGASSSASAAGSGASSSRASASIRNQSREFFVEAAQMILEGLERGYCEYDGKFVKQTRRELRPRPFKSFRGRTYAAAVSPESSRDHGAARHRHPHHPAEAVGDVRPGAERVPEDLQRGERDGRASADRRRLDLLRRERRPRRGERAEVHRRVLALRRPPLRARRRSPDEDEGLRVVRAAPAARERSRAGSTRWSSSS